MGSLSCARLNTRDAYTGQIAKCFPKLFSRWLTCFWYENGFCPSSSSNTAFFQTPDPKDNFEMAGRRRQPKVVSSV